MPYLKLKTNQTTTQEQSTELLTEFSQLMAKETAKPERYVMVELNSNQDMVFSGNSDPLAYLECKSIGLSSQQAKSLSAAISQILNTRLNIPIDRIYIEFSNCPAEYWGWNGSTFG